MYRRTLDHSSIKTRSFNLISPLMRLKLSLIACLTFLNSNRMSFIIACLLVNVCLMRLKNGYAPNAIELLMRLNNEEQLMRLTCCNYTFRSKIFNTWNLMMKPLAIGAKFNFEQNLIFNFTFYLGFDTSNCRKQSAPCLEHKLDKTNTNQERRLSNQLLDRLDRYRSSDTR